jgi:hypothetical protein
VEDSQAQGTQDGGYLPGVEMNYTDGKWVSLDPDEDVRKKKKKEKGSFLPEKVYIYQDGQWTDVTPLPEGVSTSYVKP